MKHKKYIGLFRNASGHEYELTVSTNGFLCAFFLLTAKAIDSGRHYQLATICDDSGRLVSVDDILKCSVVLLPKN